MSNFAHKDFFKKRAFLLVDTSGEKLSACLANMGDVLVKAEIFGGALENLKDLIAQVLEKASLKISDIFAFGFCEGTGSILSIRATSAMFATLRAANKGTQIFTWSLLDSYAEILKIQNGASDFSIVCPSRKNYANVLEFKSDKSNSREILSAEISQLASPIYFINQRASSDKNFENLSEVYFDCAQIFELLKSRPEFAKILDANEIADASTLAKREYVKWNFQAQH